MTAEYEHAEHIARLVAQAPPLTDAQLARLRALLAPTEQEQETGAA